MTKIKREVVTLEEWSKRRKKKDYSFESYTTVKRKGKGYYLFDPGTYEHNKFTKYAHGKGISVTINELIKLSKTNPKAYVRFLVSDGVSYSWIQIRNIRIVSNKLITEK